MKLTIQFIKQQIALCEQREEACRSIGRCEEIADTQAVIAADLRQSLAILEASGGGPIWPEPAACGCDQRDDEQCGLCRIVPTVQDFEAVRDALVRTDLWLMQMKKKQDTTPRKTCKGTGPVDSFRKSERCQNCSEPVEHAFEHHCREHGWNCIKP